MMLLGLGDSAANLQSAIDGLLLAHPEPSSSDLVSFFKTYTTDITRLEAAKALVERGVRPGAVSGALAWFETVGPISKDSIWGAVSVLAGAASAFHGYRRNQSIGWALWWGVWGTLFPVITPTLALAQGFGKRKG